MGAKQNKNEKEKDVNSNLRNNDEKQQRGKREKSEKTDMDQPSSRNDNEKKKKINLDKALQEENLEALVLKLIKKHNVQMMDYDLINNCISSHFYMQKLDKDAKTEIIKQMNLFEVEANEFVCKQGTMGFFFYIIKEGKLRVEINGKVLKTLNSGTSFGELALIHGANRSASIISETRCLLYTMERKHFRKICDHITKLNFDENKKFIESIPLLASLDSDFKSVLANNLLKEFHEKGEFVVRKGEDANCMYIIKDGSVDCQLNGKIIRSLTKGDHFGEISILTNTTRTLDVVCSSQSVIYAISTSYLESMLGENFRNTLYFSLINISFLSSSCFGKLNSKLIEQVFHLFEIKTFSFNSPVLPKNYDTADNIVVVIEGNLVDKITKQVITKRGDIVNEKDIINKKSTEFKNDLIADPDCVIAICNYSKFIEELGGTIDQLIEKSKAIESISKIALFKNFSQQKMQLISKMIKIEKFENGKNIIKQGESGNKFFIVKSGLVDIFINNRYIRSMAENACFGERALFFNEPRSATAQANGPVEVYYLVDKDFMSILEPSLKDYLYSRFYLQDASVDLKDLDFVKEVGKGSFGTVCLVTNRKTKHLYALKSMSKNHIDYEALHPNVSMEKSILLKIDHPFIVKLVKTIKDNGKFIFFLMEFIQGKELFDVIRDIGFLNDNEAKFYTASLLLAINYLHEKNIVYRDLKPENIICCENVSSINF